MAWPILGTLLTSILGGGAAGGAAAGGAAAGGAATGAGAAGAGSGLIGGGLASGVSNFLDVGSLGSNAGMQGGGAFSWDDFTKRFQSPDGWQEMQLKQNEQGRKQMAGATNLSQTVRPRGRVQELGPQSVAPYARQWPNPGTTSLQALLSQMATRRGGGI